MQHIYLHIAERDVEHTKLELTSPGSQSADLNAGVVFTCADIKSETGVHKFSRRHLMYSLTEFRYTGENYGVELFSSNRYRASRKRFVRSERSLKLNGSFTRLIINKI